MRGSLSANVWCSLYFSIILHAAHWKTEGACECADMLEIIIIIIIKRMKLGYLITTLYGLLISLTVYLKLD